MKVIIIIICSILGVYLIVAMLIGILVAFTKHPEMREEIKQPKGDNKINEKKVKHNIDFGIY